MSQTVRRSGTPQEPKWQREVSPGVAVLAGIIVLVFILIYGELVYHTKYSRKSGPAKSGHGN